MEKIRIGIVGAGANTRLRHIPGFRAIDGVEVVGVCNRSLESSNRAADEFSIPKIFDSWAELVESRDVDAVLIGTWPYMHCPVTLATLECGKHVLCEARMAMNAEEAVAMREASKMQPDLVTQIVPSPMTLAHDDTIVRLISEGYLGTVVAAEVRVFAQDFVDSETPLHWREDHRVSGINVMSLGIWYECVMRWLGEAEFVTAEGMRFVKTRKEIATNQSFSSRVPDHLSVIAQMASGPQVRFSISDIAAFGEGGGVTLYGTDGTLKISGGVLKGRRRGDSDFGDVPLNEEEVGAWRVEADFIESIRTGAPVRLTSFDLGVRYMEFTEAVAESAANGTRIPLPR